MNLNEKTIDAIACAGTALEQAQQFYLAKEAADRKAAEQVEACIEAHLKASLLDEREKQAMAKVLADHAETIAWLTKVATYHGEKLRTVEPMGAPTTPETRKSASATQGSSYSDRRTGATKESDRRYYEALGMNVPE